jgi:hypothetical protein
LKKIDIVNGSGTAFEAGTPHLLFSAPLTAGGDYDFRRQENSHEEVDEVF